MAEQVKKQRERENKAEDQVPVKKTAEEKEQQEDQKLTKLIEEIDEVLEQDAEEFVKNYVQQGGE